MPVARNWLNKQKTRDWLSDMEGNNRDVMFYQQIILDAGTTIVIERFDTITKQAIVLPAQNVRIEMTRIEPDRETGTTAQQTNFNILVFGLPTFDIQANDKFWHYDMLFRVKVGFIETPGGRQVWAQAQQ